MANLPKPDRLTSLPDVSSFAICSSVASIASLAWPLLSPVSSATARASSVLLMVPTAIPPGTGVRRRPYGARRTEKRGGVALGLEVERHRHVRVARADPEQVHVAVEVIRRTGEPVDDLHAAVVAV